jgi:hypothetical protein
MVMNDQRMLDKTAIREGLVSSLWQSWCRFVRAAILTSSTGGTTAAGVVIHNPYIGHTEAELLFIARQLSTGSSIRNIRPIAGGHLEPTWGDISKAISIVNGIGSSNSSQMLSGLSIASTVRDLQTCRNATAHIGSYQIGLLNAARVRYIHTRIAHPTDACFWIDPMTDGYLWDTWLDEIELMARNICA